MDGAPVPLPTSRPHFIPMIPRAPWSTENAQAKSLDTPFLVCVPPSHPPYSAALGQFSDAKMNGLILH